MLLLSLVITITTQTRHARCRPRCSHQNSATEPVRHKFRNGRENKGSVCRRALLVLPAATTELRGRHRVTQERHLISNKPACLASPAYSIDLRDYQELEAHLLHSYC
ncbi:hypothetical protein F4679DRAFT_540717 [Xylaria curta]|nr:hypothetical protein F4679DRAFT_540717 [Xylaria curta]